MEPDYLDSNGRINAMAVAHLFADDFAFYKPDEISWDGEHHVMTGIQFNAAKVTDYPVFVENIAQLVPRIYDFMAEIERDDELIVPRPEIASGLYGVLREGNLTGITLFNLQACGKALWIQGDGNDYRVLFDSRLGMGIPGFYRLVTRLIEDMRAYNGIEGSAQIAFNATRSFDANDYLGDVPTEVKGASYGSFHMEEIESSSQTPMEEGAADDDMLERYMAHAIDGVLKPYVTYTRQIACGSQAATDSPVASYIEKACQEKVDIANFLQKVRYLGFAFCNTAQSIAEKSYKEFTAAGGDPNSAECVLAIVTPVASFNKFVTPVFGRLLDAYDSQVRRKISVEERGAFLDALDWFAEQAFTSGDTFQSSRELIEASSIEWFNDECMGCFDRLRKSRMRFERGKARKSSSKSASKPAVESDSEMGGMTQETASRQNVSNGTNGLVCDQLMQISSTESGAGILLYAMAAIGQAQPDEDTPASRLIRNACSKKVSVKDLCQTIDTLGDVFAILSSQFAVEMVNQFEEPNGGLSYLEFALTMLTPQLEFNDHVASVFAQLLDAYDAQARRKATSEERAMLLDVLKKFGKQAFLSKNTFPISLAGLNGANKIEWHTDKCKECFRRLQADCKQLKQGGSKQVSGNVGSTTKPKPKASSKSRSQSISKPTSAPDSSTSKSSAPDSKPATPTPKPEQSKVDSEALALVTVEEEKLKKLEDQLETCRQECIVARGKLDEALQRRESIEASAEKEIDSIRKSIKQVKWGRLGWSFAFGIASIIMPIFGPGIGYFIAVSCLLLWACYLVGFLFSIVLAIISRICALISKRKANARRDNEIREIDWATKTLIRKADATDFKMTVAQTACDDQKAIVEQIRYGGVCQAP